MEVHEDDVKGVGPPRRVQRLQRRLAILCSDYVGAAHALQNAERHLGGRTMRRGQVAGSVQSDSGERRQRGHKGGRGLEQGLQGRQAACLLLVNPNARPLPIVPRLPDPAHPEPHPTLACYPPSY